MLPTLFTPLLGSPQHRFFLFSSSLQFVFSEQRRFEHQLRSQLLSSRIVSRSIKHQQLKSASLKTTLNSDQGSTKQNNKQNWSRSLRRHGLTSLTVMTAMPFHQPDRSKSTIVIKPANHKSAPQSSNSKQPSGWVPATDWWPSLSVCPQEQPVQNVH